MNEHHHPDSERKSRAELLHGGRKMRGPSTPTCTPPPNHSSQCTPSPSARTPTPPPQHGSPYTVRKHHLSPAPVSRTPPVSRVGGITPQSVAHSHHPRSPSPALHRTPPPQSQGESSRGHRNLTLNIKVSLWLFMNMLVVSFFEFEKRFHEFQ